MSTLFWTFILLLFFILYGLVWFCIHMRDFYFFLKQKIKDSGFRRSVSTKHFKEIKIQE